LYIGLLVIRLSRDIFSIIISIWSWNVEFVLWPTLKLCNFNFYEGAVQQST
jgi:hypothetical protein